MPKHTAKKKAMKEAKQAARSSFAAQGKSNPGKKAAKVVGAKRVGKRKRS